MAVGAPWAAAAAAPKTEPAKPAAGSVAVAGIELKAPGSWVREEEASEVRRAQFSVPPARKDGQPADVAVFYFGKEKGGTVPLNLDRWRRTMRSPTGEMMVGDVGERMVDGVAVTELVLYGTRLTPSLVPGLPPSPAEDQGLAAAVIEAPQGNVFVQMTGAEGAVRERLGDFRGFVDSFGKPAPKEAAAPAAKKKKKRR